MKSILLLAVLLALTSLSLNFFLFGVITENQIRLDKIYRFAQQQIAYNSYLDDASTCLMFKDGQNSNDIWLASQGRTRQSLKGTELGKELPVRDPYDLQIPECARDAEWRGWTTYGPWQYNE